MPGIARVFSRFGAKREKTRAIPGILQVEDHAALVSVEHGEADSVGLAAARVDLRRPVAEAIAAGRLYFHYVGTEIGEQQRGERPGGELRDLQDFEACERLGHWLKIANRALEPPFPRESADAPQYLRRERLVRRRALAGVSGQLAQRPEDLRPAGPGVAHRRRQARLVRRSLRAQAHAALRGRSPLRRRARVPVPRVLLRRRRQLRAHPVAAQ